MPRIQLYLGKEGYAWAKSKPQGYLRKVLDGARRTEQKGNQPSPQDKPGINGKVVEK